MVPLFTRLIICLNRRLIGRSAALCAALLPALCGACPVFGQAQPEVLVTMANGDRVSGRFVAVKAEHLQIENSYAGRISIRLAEISNWQTSNDQLRKQLKSLLSLLPLLKDQTKVVDAKKPPSKLAPLPARPDPWQRSLTFSYTLTQGNVNLNDLVAAFSASRRRGSRRLAFNAAGRYGVRNGAEIAHLFNSTLRYERTLVRLPIFTETSFEIDRVKKLDYRLSENAGLTYQFLKGEGPSLRFDFGAGLTQEVYRTGLKRTTAQSLLRATATQQLNGKAQLNQQITLFSDLLDPSGYRLHAEASVTTPITKHIALRLAGVNRYDHRPQRFVKPNDFSLLTGLSFNF